MIEIAREYGLIIIEDDPYTSLYPNTEPALKAINNDVIYVGTFSKILGPRLEDWIRNSKW
ncbi:hypothetical protein [Vulcanisaeta distributa]|uniref:hypothetical protein n=1 Tax=Vulcanisaeta distributa TaxID=164451 RepID=UPI001FB2FDCC|nr:hypothetical protein [Vulcanisaeta distributa]